MPQDYEVTVTAEGRKTPLLRYRGPVPKVSGLAVQRTPDDQVELVYATDAPPGMPVVLDSAKDPDVPLTLVRQSLDADLKRTGSPVERPVS